MENNEIIAIADRISDKLIAIVKKQLGEPQAQPGPRWVKASRGHIPDGIHSMKLVSRDDVIMRGTGLVNNNTITLITFLNKTTMGVNDLPKDYEGIYYLDEQPAAGREEDDGTMYDATWGYPT